MLLKWGGEIEDWLHPSCVCVCVPSFWDHSAHWLTMWSRTIGALWVDIVYVCVLRGGRQSGQGLGWLNWGQRVLSQTNYTAFVCFCMWQYMFFQTWITLTDKVNPSSCVAMVAAVISLSEVIWWTVFLFIWGVFLCLFFFWSHLNCWRPRHEQDAL